jgi:peptidase M15-like protein
MVAAMLHLLLASAAALAGQVAAQTPAPAPPAAVWNPAAPYITAGQDEPGYRSWYLSAPWRAGQVKAFNDYLVAGGVGGVVPTWQLLRTATSWAECGGQPFEIAPTSEWPNMVQTLRYIRDYVIPVVGPVEPVSAYRNPVLNVCAGGAPQSAHMLDSAVDMVPLRPIDRETMMRMLCGPHSAHGADYSAGLGFYAFMRFHVDSTKFRRWNMDPAVAAQCPPIIHVGDAASSGQPLPPASTVIAPGPAIAPAPGSPSVPVPATGSAPPPLIQTQIPPTH